MFFNRDNICSDYRLLAKQEGYYYAFVYKGLPCRLIRVPVGHWCGYVGVPKNNPYYGKDYLDFDIMVHGGVTYCGDDLIMQPEEDVWRIGFDTAHTGDKSIYRGNEGLSFSDGVYRDKKYVISETKKLAKQLLQ